MAGASSAHAERSPERAEGTYRAEIIAAGAARFDLILDVSRQGKALKTRVTNGGDINLTGVSVVADAVTLSVTYQGDPFTLPGGFTENRMGRRATASGPA